MKHYKVLELEMTATPEEIKKAYRKLSKEWHPDVCQDPEAESIFKMIKEAYEVLIDPEKRKAYDMFGDTGGKTIQDEIEKFLADHVMDHLLQTYDISNFSSVDMVDEMKEIVRQQDDHQLRSENQLTRKLEKMDVFLSKIKLEGNSKFMAKAYQSRREKYELQLNQVKDQRKFLSTVKETLTEMKYQ